MRFLSSLFSIRPYFDIASLFHHVLDGVKYYRKDDCRMMFDIFIIRKGIKYRQENFTVISVKQGLDAMEEGICFYTENGLPQFTNKYMNDVSLAISGRTIVDASKFWKDLHDGNIKPDCRIITSIEDMVIKP